LQIEWRRGQATGYQELATRGLSTVSRIGYVLILAKLVSIVEGQLLFEAGKMAGVALPVTSKDRNTSQKYRMILERFITAGLSRALVKNFFIAEVVKAFRESRPRLASSHT
jgi:hypothetical protein